MSESVLEPCSCRFDVSGLTRQFEDADMHVGSLSFYGQC